MGDGPIVETVDQVQKEDPSLIVGEPVDRRRNDLSTFLTLHSIRRVVSVARLGPTTTGLGFMSAAS